MKLFLALSPRLRPVPQPEPPQHLNPFESVPVARANGRAPLTASWFPAAAAHPKGARGAVLLLHPWLVWGKAYFHLRGRIEALRNAGYHVLAPDFAGFGGSGAPRGFFDQDVESALELLHHRAGGLPLHVWGVSAGGYWAHPVLSRTDLVAGAMFEDVAPHLLEWSWRVAPLGRPFYLFFRACFSGAYRYLDARRHAGLASLAAVTYISGEKDRGVRPEDTRTLAELAGARHRIVPGADHLSSIKTAGEEVIGLALETFRLAEERRSGAVLDGLEDRTGEIEPPPAPAADLLEETFLLK